MIENIPGKIPSPDYDSFEAQYARKTTFSINGADVNSVDIKPRELKNEVPVLVAPGWAATMQSFEPALKVLADRGRRAICLDHPRTGGTIADMRNEDAEAWYASRGEKFPKLPQEELRKAQTLLGLLERKNLDKVDVVAHSEGAINTCIAAMLKPEKFIGRTIVLYSPAGLIGKDNPLRLLMGSQGTKPRTESIKDIPVTEAETEYLKTTKNIMPDYMAANRTRMIKELWAISKAQIDDMLRYLHSKGVRIIVMEGVDDTMFPMNKMQKNVHSTAVEDGFVDGFVSVTGGHMQIQVHPEKYMGAIETML